jgi:hypothetical protein
VWVRDELRDNPITDFHAPFATQVTQLDDIPGLGMIGAQELIAELGVDMTRFPTTGHLASWAKFAPVDHKSAGKCKAAATGKGNPWLAGTLGEIVAGFARTNSFLGHRYRRLSKRRGTNRAIVAAGNSVLTIIWHLLANPQARYHDLGTDFPHTIAHTAHRQRALIRQLERLTGKKVTLHPTIRTHRQLTTSQHLNPAPLRSVGLNPPGVSGGSIS